MILRQGQGKRLFYERSVLLRYMTGVKNGLLTQPVGQKNYLETAPNAARKCSNMIGRLHKISYTLKSPSNAKSPRTKAAGALAACTNKHQQANINSKKPFKQVDVPTAFVQGESGRWYCAARREITRPKGGKLPQQKTRSPRRLAEVGKPNRIVRSECRWGFEG